MSSNELSINLFACPQAIDELKFIREIISMRGFLSQLVDATRDYEKYLDFACWALDILYKRKHELDIKEFESLDEQLIVTKLLMLDYTNQWQKYLDYFKEIRQSRHYVHHQCVRIDEPYFDDHLINTDGNDYWLHFLYMQANREAIIRRKYERQMAGKSVEHLKRHPKSKLTDDEIMDRYTRTRQHIEWCLAHPHF